MEKNRFLSLLLILFVFAGNMGLNVFTHTCKREGVFQSYILPIKHKCSAEQLKVKSCCQRIQEEEDDCCQDEIDSYHLSFDYFQDLEKRISCASLITDSAPIFSFLYPAYCQLESKLLLLHPPPARSGRELLCRLQVYRI